MKHIRVDSNFKNVNQTTYWGSRYTTQKSVEANKNDKFKDRTELSKFFENITTEYTINHYSNNYEITLAINNELVFINTCALKYLSKEKLVNTLIENNIINKPKTIEPKQTQERECYETY